MFWGENWSLKTSENNCFTNVNTSCKLGQNGPHEKSLLLTITKASQEEQPRNIRKERCKSAGLLEIYPTLI